MLLGEGFRRFFRSSNDVDRDIREELEAHLEMKVEDLIASGLSRERAEAEARRLLGDRAWVVEECRKVRVHIRRSESRKERFDTLRQDVRYAVRRMQRAPAVTALVIAVLGLGIGVNTTVFSAVNDWFFRGAPGVNEPDRLVALFRSFGPDDRTRLGHLSYLKYAEQVESFTGLAASRPVRMVLQEDDGTALVQTKLVSANYFDVLGVDMTVGRGFLPEEEQEAGTHPVAVISHTFWRDRLGSPGGLSSEAIRLNGMVFTVVGVAGERFRGLEALDDVDVWVPLAMEATARTPFPIWKSDRWSGILTVVGRLVPGVTRDAAQAELAVLATRIAEPDRRRGMRGSIAMDPNVRTQELVSSSAVARIPPFAGVAGLVLLLACVNIGGLLLVQAMERRREISYRCALGAGRGRIVRQLLTESLVLAVPGAIVGLIASRWLGWGVARYIAPGVRLPLDAHVLAFAVVLGVAATFLFGLVPALHVFKSTSGSNANFGASRLSGRGRALSALAVTQIALTMLLLTVGGSFAKQLRMADDTGPGFETETLLLIEPDLRRAGRSEPEIRDFYHTLVDRIAAVPGIRNVTVAGNAPRVRNLIGWGGRTVRADGVESEDGVRVEYNDVHPKYFETLGVEILQGRGIEASDNRTSAPVAVVNQTMAHQFWGSEDVVGRTVRIVGNSGDSDPLEVVGVVRDSRTFVLKGEVPPELFVSLEQNGRANLVVLARISGDFDAVAQAIRSEIRSLDRGLPPVTIETLADRVADTLAENRSWADVASGFGVVALALALIGLYGTMAFAVSQRVPEFCVRIALGAAPGKVVGHVFRRGLVLTVLGGLIGLMISFALTPLAAAYLDESLGRMNERPDVAIVFACFLLLAAAGVTACSGPARAAMKVNPMDVLRHD
jgi:putative ABC transport system permease protein